MTDSKLAHDTWTRLSSLFREACQLDPPARAALLESTRAQDPSLADELESLLASDDSSHRDPFLEPHPEVGGAVRQAATDIAREQTGEPTEPTAPIRPGARIGDFELGERIASGGMGVVHEGRQEYPARRVAIKIMHAGLTTPRLLERFRLEGDVLAKLDHPGIASIFAAGSVDDGSGGRPWLAMEYVDGARPITSAAREDKTDARGRVAQLLEAAHAVRHAHQRGVIHRDLKPGNILMDEHGRVKVIDFGVARAVDEVTSSGRQTSQGELIGTLAYMAPEQSSGSLDGVDVRCDVYALGVVLHELLTGRRPIDFDGLSIGEAIQKLRDAPPPRLDDTLPGVDADLQTIVRTAMSTSPEDRYQSMDGLIRDLELWLLGEPITARPPGVVRRVQLFAKRHRVLTGVAAAIMVSAVVLAGMAAHFTWRVTNESNARQVALDRRERVLDFLQSILASNSVDGSGGRTTTLEDVLDFASRNVRSELAGDPESLADVHFAIAESYRSLGMTDAARRHAESHQDLMSVLHGADSVPYARGLELLGGVERDAGRFADATRHYEGAESIFLEHGDDQAVAALLARINQYGLAIDRGRPGAAIEGLRDCLDQLLRLPSADALQIAAAKTVLALAINDGGRPSEAEPIFRSVLATYDAEWDQPHRRRVSAINNVGWSLSKQSRFDEAAALFTQAVEMANVVYGEEDHRTLFFEANLQQAHADAGRWHLATPMAERLLAKAERIGFVRPQYHANLEAAYARALAATGRTDEAVVYSERALDRFRDAEGPNSANTARASQWLARHHLTLGRFDLAEPLLRESLSITERRTGDTSEATALSLNELAFGLMQHGERQEALPYFQRALRIRNERNEPNHLERLKSLHNLGRCLALLDRGTEAAPYLEEAVDRGTDSLTDDHWILAVMRSTYGLVLHDLGRDDEAEPRLAAALPVLESTYGPDHDRVVSTRAALDAILAATP